MNRRKIMLLGDIGVGKSSIVRRLVFDEFDHNYKPTLGVDVYSCEIAPDPPPTRLPPSSSSGILTATSATASFPSSIFVRRRRRSSSAI